MSNGRSITGGPESAVVSALPRPVPGIRVCVRLNLGGCGPYAHIVADVEPPGPGGGLELLSAVPEELLPREHLPALRRGLLEGLGGVAAAVLVTDGHYHDADSSDLGYLIAGRQAGRAALVGAGLLPPGEAEALRWASWPGRPRPRRRGGGRRW
ncbi:MULTISPECIES: hypothetical protein [Streptomyces]|uniref:hypothetical protein n=1 Tax=Streptomyces TaxID=1883 RepID=UPI00163C94BB|nr:MULTISPECIES: hypothetical protein [Streptomyces]MBC2873593.1 hypothetical protein [Streptomyces sp. TYQ1024]UBI36890.1 hypothetical protein K7I03_10730 [Streptomyces mobaraensis]UKW29482.1 hypothetical protein MCU78_10705 [Streptomyces sp. TYQ1024]